jgi:thioredoxin-dependent peroxiredoxin
MTKLTAGDIAPPFALSDQHGGIVHLEDFRGGPLLVFFYPEADTPGCTTQSCEVRDHRQEFDDLGVQVVGISPDEPADQLAFDQKYSLGFPLLSDTDHSVAEAWGVWGEKKLYGNTFEGVIRSSFLVDEAGRIAEAWYKVQPAQTVPKAMAALRG